jgi:DNA-binding MarR family transcriptional regulator
MSSDSDNTVAPRWNLLSNHALVLVCLARDPDLRLRDIADLVSVTERTAFAIVHDLCDAGILERTKVGRRNRYVVIDDSFARVGANHEMPVAPLLGVMARIRRAA